MMKIVRVVLSACMLAAVGAYSQQCQAKIDEARPCREAAFNQSCVDLHNSNNYKKWATTFNNPDLSCMVVFKSGQGNHWDHAKTRCTDAVSSSKSGHLVVLSDQAAVNRAADLLDNWGQKYENSYIMWVGLQQQSGTGQPEGGIECAKNSALCDGWQQVTDGGQLVDATNIPWGNGQPNNNRAAASSNCGALAGGEIQGTGAPRLIDVPCSNNHWYICQYDFQP